MDINLVKYYEDIVIKKSDDYDKLSKALNVTKSFILKRKLLLVGGMSIDYALKSKGAEGIYDDNTVPDFDVLSDTHWQDAYELAVLLAKADITGISVINALHPSTMKVRVDFKEVLDITYIPPNIIENIPVIYYRGYTMAHPHFQFIDQHRSLSYPYENAPRETILHRPLKDMIRYDMLYEHYPLRMLYIRSTHINLIKRQINLDIINDQCISGFVALNYWVNEAKQLGFKTNINLGSFSTQNNNIDFSVPDDVGGIVLYSDDINKLVNILKTNKEYNETNNQNNKETTKFYTKFLDKLPRSILLSDKFELFDNNMQLAAHKITKSNKVIYIANLQSIMMYLLCKYILMMKIKGGYRSYSFYIGYLLCRDLIQWASEELSEKNLDKMKLFLPTAEVYGNHNFSDAYIVSKLNFDLKNNTATPEMKDKYSQPRHIYDRDLIYKKIPKKYMEYDTKHSIIYDIGGAEITNFLDF